MTFHDPQLARQAYEAGASRVTVAQLVESHVPLVRKLAWHVHGRMSRTAEIEDLLQIGMVALVEAAKSFEDRGLGFTNYAKLRVRGAMIDDLRRQSNLSRAAMQFRKRLRQVDDQLAQTLGRVPDQRELAAAMGMQVADFRDAFEASQSADTRSIDEAYSDHSPWFVDEAPAADELIETEQRQEELAHAIAQLPEREAMVLQLYFVEELNLDEIGRTLNVGAARVCQIKKAALEKVRGILTA